MSRERRSKRARTSSDLIASLEPGMFWVSLDSPNGDTMASASLVIKQRASPQPGAGDGPHLASSQRRRNAGSSARGLVAEIAWECRHPLGWGGIVAQSTMRLRATLTARRRRPPGGCE